MEIFSEGDCTEGSIVLPNRWRLVKNANMGAAVYASTNFPSGRQDVSQDLLSESTPRPELADRFKTPTMGLFL
jgi:hypothetical protein